MLFTVSTRWSKRWMKHFQAMLSGMGTGRENQRMWKLGACSYAGKWKMIQGAEGFCFVLQVAQAQKQ